MYPGYDSQTKLYVIICTTEANFMEDSYAMMNEISSEGSWFISL